jgi:hypothetical protein
MQFSKTRKPQRKSQQRAEDTSLPLVKRSLVELFSDKQCVHASCCLARRVNASTPKFIAAATPEDVCIAVRNFGQQRYAIGLCEHPAESADGFKRSNASAFRFEQRVNLLDTGAEAFRHSRPDR